MSKCRGESIPDLNLWREAKVVRRAQERSEATPGHNH